ncbi:MULTISPECIES: 3-hydroxyisobutyryl-CoA hydrolase [unclassified Luteococcus]|uniref:3-hydroxyisobutyryl-CoA hydrolase n=1 Tax=unclassified Luteococcus TaxID=2639923 RepID=UPI00313CC6FF
MTPEATPTDAVVAEPTPAEIRTERDGDTARLVLDRPRAINALSPQMMHTISQTLQAWQEDPSVERIELVGEGERGFCAGADVRAIRQLVLEQPEQAVDFFTEEYQVNALIAGSAKPITSQLHGIAMGGGLGLALHATHVVTTPDLKLAMPEVGIGLFPDVGVCWQLACAPGQTGAYLAMTGTTIDAASALYAGMVHEILLPERFDAAPPEPRGAVSPELMDAAEGSQLAQDRSWIDECFTGDDPAGILARLEGHGNPRARQCAGEIRAKSPWSVCVALEAVRRAGQLESVRQVLAQDLVLARSFVADSDFVEGVRAQLVDKDRNPSWRHARVEDVPRELVLGMFQER